jgi:hypothetical protein
MLRQNSHFQLSATPQQRIEHSACAIRDWEELSGLFAFECYSQGLKPANRRLLIKRCEDITDNIPGTIEVVRQDFIVRDVAASTAGDEDLRTNLFRGVQEHDPYVTPR